MTTLLNHPLISPGKLSRWLGVYTCHALNKLGEHPCCRRCCAPCGALDEMTRLGVLDNVVKQAPTWLWEDAAWFHGQTVDMRWLDARWGCQSSPPCHDAEPLPGGPR